jgi:hypothetical protein
MNTLIPFPLPAVADSAQKRRELIERRAAELWRELGCPKNRDLAIWLEAEAEIGATRAGAFRHPHSLLEGNGRT